MDDLINKLTKDFPDIAFKPGGRFAWSPETNEVIYNIKKTNQSAKWSLLHELGHGLLGHQSYASDVALLKLEVAAWAKAKAVGLTYNITIGEQHIESCLDTYRDWLYKRSICPNCNNQCLQQNDYIHYQCFNCHTIWRVSSNRFCRAYRSTKKVSQTSVLNI
jgi:hypothetical protein